MNTIRPMHFAAAMHDLRNRYAGFLSVIKAGLLTGPQIKEERYSLEREEKMILPATSNKDVKKASIAL